VQEILLSGTNWFMYVNGDDSLCYMKNDVSILRSNNVTLD